MDDKTLERLSVSANIQNLDKGPLEDVLDAGRSPPDVAAAPKASKPQPGRHHPSKTIRVAPQGEDQFWPAVIVLLTAVKAAPPASVSRGRIRRVCLFLPNPYVKEVLMTRTSDPNPGIWGALVAFLILLALVILGS